MEFVFILNCQWLCLFSSPGSLMVLLAIQYSSLDNKFLISFYPVNSICQQPQPMVFSKSTSSIFFLFSLPCPPFLNEARNGQAIQLQSNFAPSLHQTKSSFLDFYYWNLCTYFFLNTFVKNRWLFQQRKALNSWTLFHFMSALKPVNSFLSSSRSCNTLTNADENHQHTTNA